MSVPPYKFVLFLGTKSGKIVRIVDVFENPQVDILDIGREILDFIGCAFFSACSNYPNTFMVCTNGKLYVVDKVNMNIVKEIEIDQFINPIFCTDIHYHDDFRLTPLIVTDVYNDRFEGKVYYFDEKYQISKVDDINCTFEPVQGNVVTISREYGYGFIGVLYDQRYSTGLYVYTETESGVVLKCDRSILQFSIESNIIKGVANIGFWFYAPCKDIVILEGNYVCNLNGDCNESSFSNYVPFEFLACTDYSYYEDIDAITIDGHIVRYNVESSKPPVEVLDTLYPYMKHIALEYVTEYTDYYYDKYLFYSRDVNNVLKVVLWNLETRIEKDIDIGIVDVVNVAFANVWK